MRCGRGKTFAKPVEYPRSRRHGMVVVRYDWTVLHIWVEVMELLGEAMMILSAPDNPSICVDVQSFPRLNFAQNSRNVRYSRNSEFARNNGAV